MDLTPHARRIVELAREQRTPSEQDLTRIEARIALGLGVTAAAAVVAAESAKVGTGAKAAALISASKWIAGAALLAAGLASYAARSAPVAVLLPAHSSAERARPVAPALAPVPAASVVEARAPQAKSAPAAVRHAVRVLERTRRMPADSGAAEVELLHRAQAAWRARDAGTALSLLREHRARFAHSALRLERDTLQVLTLCALGRKAEAARLGRGLLADAPRSPLRASIEESCALE